MTIKWHALHFFPEVYACILEIGEYTFILVKKPGRINMIVETPDISMRGKVLDL